MKAKIALIAAVAPGGIIGHENKMPWHLPNDLRYFKRVTLGHSIIMGRKTFESLQCKALPKRKNIVVTRNREYTASGCDVVHSLKEAIAISGNAKQIFIIGGGQLYAAAISLADKIYLTRIGNKNRTGELFELFRGDTFFPEIKASEWKETHQGRQFLAAKTMHDQTQIKDSGIYFQRFIYTRIPKKEDTETIT
ncbi:MAG: dihydrofolate reductase [Nitrosomonadales bacterium]|jgi:dihydrofolate reductase|nr:MAG: dihydrofolate reductase [Nitrosomonadales bacterium]